jgi:excisionase family DNA binding protein
MIKLFQESLPAPRIIRAGGTQEKKLATGSHRRAEVNRMKSMKVKEVAERLDVSPGMIYRLCRSRKLRHLRVGGTRGPIRIPEDALDSLILVLPVQSAETETSSVALPLA